MEAIWVQERFEEQKQNLQILKNTMKLLQLKLSHVYMQMSTHFLAYHLNICQNISTKQTDTPVMINNHSAQGLIRDGKTTISFLSWWKGKKCEVGVGQSNMRTGEKEIQQDPDREILRRNVRTSLGRKQGCAFIIKEAVYYEGKV